MSRTPKEQPPVKTPTRKLVEEACARFDLENKTAEEALTDLFGHYSSNNNNAHVLLKVIALDRLYNTHILGVYDVASHIYLQSQGVDAALAIGSPGIVDRIAPVKMSSTGKVRINYSFATKYCSWHNPTAYPIWDARVNRYFLRLRWQNPALPFPRPSGYLWDQYHEFLTLVTAFRDHYELGSLTFKQLDKFLYQEGGE